MSNQNFDHSATTLVSDEDLRQHFSNKRILNTEPSESEWEMPDNEDDTCTCLRYFEGLISPDFYWLFKHGRLLYD